MTYLDVQFNVFMIDQKFRKSEIVQLWNDHLPQKILIYVVCFDHLLLPSSRLWNAIQFGGCDWWRGSEGFIPTARKGPPVADKPVTSLGSHSNK